MNTPAPHFVCCITFQLPGTDDTVIASIWANDDDFCTVWSSGGGDAFKEHRIRCGAPPRGVGPGLWALVNVLANMADAKFRGMVHMVLTGAVGEAGYELATAFVNEHMPKFEAADLC